jgi:hypothetical protein
MECASGSTSSIPKHEGSVLRRTRKICNGAKRNKKEAGRGQQQDLNYHSLPTSSSRPAAATTNTAAIEEHNRESIARTTPPQPPPPMPLFNIYEYFQPVFDEVGQFE